MVKELLFVLFVFGAFNRDKNGNTQAMKQAIKGQIPQQKYYHDPELQNENGFTVAMLLAQNNIEIPEEWYHDPNIQNKEGRTVAMIIIDNCDNVQQLNIPKQWWHKPELRGQHHGRDNFGFSVDKDTMAMRYAYNQMIPPEQWNHKPTLLSKIDQIQYEEHSDSSCYFGKLTVGMILAVQNIIPTKQWMTKETQGRMLLHDNVTYSGDFYQNVTLQSILLEQQLPIPQHWKENEQLTIFDQAIFREIPSIEDHKPEEQDKDRFTVAMILACNNIDIPKEWQHDPNIQNTYKYTVALLQARNGKIPDKQWQHNKFIRADFSNLNAYEPKHYTVQNLLKLKNIKVPDEWKYDNIIDDEDNTQAIKQAKQGKIPDKKYYHDPLQTNMENETVAYILSLQGIIPPKEWMITEQQNKKMFNKIKRQLENLDYAYINQLFIYNCKTEILNDICQICLQEGQQEFAKTNCGHKICLSCFKQLSYIAKKQCPICKQKNWVQRYQPQKNILDSVLIKFDEI